MTLPGRPARGLPRPAAGPGRLRRPSHTVERVSRVVLLLLVLLSVPVALVAGTAGGPASGPASSRGGAAACPDRRRRAGRAPAP